VHPVPSFHRCIDRQSFADISHSGIQLISMAREAQNKPEDALQLATQVLEFRRKRFGGRFKTCDSLCRVGKLLIALNKPKAALSVMPTYGSSAP
jgi:hypothetical protein